MINEYNIRHNHIRKKWNWTQGGEKSNNYN